GARPLTTGDWSSTPRGTLIRLVGEPHHRADQTREKEREPEHPDDAPPVGRRETFLLLLREPVLDIYQTQAEENDDPHPLVDLDHGLRSTSAEARSLPDFDCGQKTAPGICITRRGKEQCPSQDQAGRGTGTLALGSIALAAIGSARAADAACSAYTGPHTTALVELYTSEGCDTCPPADHWLSSLFSRGFRSDQVVPLSLHVDYWDYIGWKDPFGKSEFSARQRKLAAMRRPVVVYTPQQVVQGQDFRRWASDDFTEEVSRINSRAARARIALAIR